MIELRANIPESEWRTEQPMPAELPTGMTEAEWRDIAAPHVVQLVTIRHPGFSDGLWQLRLPEKIADDKDTTSGSRIWPYQAGMQWSESPGGWSFTECPIAGLEGTLQATINASQDTVDYSLGMTNQSKKTWRGVLAWLCFNHSRAKRYYQYRNLVFRGREMIQTPRDAMEHYCVQGHTRNWWTQGAIEPTESLITTSCRDEEGKEFAVGIGASQAIMVGQNPKWPCTDIGLFFGEISPGQRAVVDGRIYFTYGTPMEILKLYHQDFG